MAQAKLAADLGSSALDQLALADFIEHGELDRHLRRMRAIYRLVAMRSSRAWPATCPRRGPRVRRPGSTSSPGCRPASMKPQLVAEAAEAGIGLQGVAAGFAGHPPRGGLIFGYSSLDERRIDIGLRTLATLGAWRTVAPAA